MIQVGNDLGRLKLTKFMGTINTSSHKEEIL